jgi:hypothetical protein
MAIKVTQPFGVGGSITSEFNEATGYEVVDNCLILFRSIGNTRGSEIFATFAPGAWLHVEKGLNDDGEQQ